jgi:hypothetical protein
LNAQHLSWDDRPSAERDDGPSDAIGASLDCAAETARAHVLQALRQIRRGLDGLTIPRAEWRSRERRHDGRALTNKRSGLRGTGEVDVGFGVGLPSRAVAGRRGA